MPSSSVAMRRCLAVAAAVLFSALLAVSPACATTAPSPSSSPSSPSAPVVVPFALSPLRSKPPLEWSVGDVETWMNTTIGYAEYGAYLRANLVDGVTLLEMAPEDFESFLPLTNALHAIKIAAHVKLLRGLCRCDSGNGDGETAVVGFWQYMRQHSVRTWVWGTTALFFPRWAMAGVYLFDHDLYVDMLRRTDAPAGLATANDAVNGDGDAVLAVPTAAAVDGMQAAIYWGSFVVVPDVYLAYHAARHARGNYVLMPLVVLHFLAQTFSEVSLLVTIYRRTAFKPGTTPLQAVWTIFSYTLFAPVLGVVAGFVFPVFLQYIAVAVIMAHSLLMIIGIVILVINDGISAATTGPEDPTASAAAEGDGDRHGKEDEEKVSGNESVD